MLKQEPLGGYRGRKGKEYIDEDKAYKKYSERCNKSPVVLHLETI